MSSDSDTELVSMSSDSTSELVSMSSDSDSSIEISPEELEMMRNYDARGTRACDFQHGFRDYLGSGSNRLSPVRHRIPLHMCAIVY